MLFQAFANARKMTALTFSINPVLHKSEARSRTLLGWALEGGTSTPAAVLLNQGSERRVSLGGIHTEGAAVVCLAPAVQEDVTRSGLMATVTRVLHAIRTAHVHVHVCF